MLKTVQDVRIKAIEAACSRARNELYDAWAEAVCLEDGYEELASMLVHLEKAVPSKREIRRLADDADA